MYMKETSLGIKSEKSKRLNGGADQMALFSVPADGRGPARGEGSVSQQGSPCPTRAAGLPGHPERSAASWTVLG